MEQRIGPIIDGQHFRAPPLHLEAKPSVPGTDVEHALAAEILGNGKLRDAVLQPRQVANALDERAIRQLEAVPPSALGPFMVPSLDQIVAGQFSLRCHGFRISRLWHGKIVMKSKDCARCTRTSSMRAATKQLQTLQLPNFPLAYFASSRASRCSAFSV